MFVKEAEIHGTHYYTVLMVLFTNRYKVSQTQTEYTDVKRPSRNVSATRLRRKSGEAVYETIDNEGGNNAYSTAISIQDNPAYQVTGSQPSNDSVYS